MIPSQLTADPAGPPGANTAAAPTTERVRTIGMIAYACYACLVCWASTQFIAAYCQYDASLGAPLFGGIYPPQAGIFWMMHFFHAAPLWFTEIITVDLTALVSGVLIYQFASGFILNAARAHEGIHGTAHFASDKEIQDTGLLPTKSKPGAGVVIGGWQDKGGAIHYLRHDGPEHVGLFAPTRSGKGVSCVLPTLLSWTHSAFVIDLKGELANLTSGWRGREGGNRILCFAPADKEGSCKYNPLDEIRLGTEDEVADAENIATLIADPNGQGLDGQDAHWKKSGRAFLTGAILHVCHKKRAEGEVASLADLSYAIANQGTLNNELLKAKHPGPGCKVVNAEGQKMKSRPETEGGSIISTVQAWLSLYADPVVARNTATSDFHIHDLMNSQTPVTVYIVIGPEDKDRMTPLIRLMMSQVMRILLRPRLQFINGRAQMPHKHRLLMLIDEFPSYGKLAIIEESLAFCASHGIKCMLICQDRDQLTKQHAYGREETITSNLQVIGAFAPGKLDTAEWLSKMLGTTTAIKQHVSISGKRFGIASNQVSKDYQEVSRPLMTADEVMHLRGALKSGESIVAPGEMLIFVAGHAPIRGIQTPYFMDPTYRMRAALPPIGIGAGPVAGSDPGRKGPSLVEPFEL